MFPHIPLQAITLDLADTHSVSLTVDRALNNTIYIPEQGQLRQQPHPQQQLLPPQGAESIAAEPHPLTGSQHTSSLHHGSSTEGESMCGSSDQDNGSSAETNSMSGMSSRDSSETPPDNEHDSRLSSCSRETESDDAHSDSSALEEARSQTVLRRRKHRRRPEMNAEDSSICSSTDATTETTTVSLSSSMEEKMETLAGDRIRQTLSSTNRETESVGAQLGGGQRTGVVYAGRVVAGSLEREQRSGEGRLGSFSSLQQRKEEMLKRAREWVECAYTIIGGCNVFFIAVL